uniref:Small ribosomal subunit protein uS11c n=1 Tax=Desmarestia aculeata TaxID=62298 RepID=A0A8F0K091_9PHAE|nr:30S ribosomal protein S11 [Desmarestia aculeata]QWK43728.1 ribosomal protein S11 [Desmarestia aculeata]WAM62855.1 30S ribosomal protein S11 [Desmarestia aculeata]
MKKKMKRTIVTGTMHVYATFNNTIVTVSDLNGNTLSWASAGTVDFKGSRKGTPFASQKAAEKATLKARELYGLKRLEVVVKGSGPGREPAIRAVYQKGIRIVSIKDVTFIPYNGCRPPKRRRV